MLAAGPAVTLRSFLASRAAAGADWALAAEGRIQHSPQERRLIIYSRSSVLPQWSKPNIHINVFSPGPAHKLTYEILKENFPSYSSIVWRDG